MDRYPHDPDIVALNARVAAHSGEPADLGDLVSQLLAMNSANHAQLRIDVADTLLLRAAASKDLAAKTSGARANDADYVFITFILHELPHGVIGLLIAAFFAAALSSKAAEPAPWSQRTPTARPRVTAKPQAKATRSSSFERIFRARLNPVRSPR